VAIVSISRRPPGHLMLGGGSGRSARITYAWKSLYGVHKCYAETCFVPQSAFEAVLCSACAVSAILFRNPTYSYL
jgi:hypothetical protein